MGDAYLVVSIIGVTELNRVESRAVTRRLVASSKAHADQKWVLTPVVLVIVVPISEIWITA